MFKTALTAAIAALTLATATVGSSQDAEAKGLGKFIAAGIVGAVIGTALSARPAQAYQPSYQPAYRPAHGGCGFRNSPVFDEYGRQIGVQRLPRC